MHDPHRRQHRGRWAVFLAGSGQQGGAVRISYYDDSNDDLKYAVFDGVSWQIEAVDSQGEVGSYTSLALDGTGRPHISYYDETNGDLKYAVGIPEPSTLALLGIGAVGLPWCARRKRPRDQAACR